jgi:hypothetical protein
MLAKIENNLLKIKKDLSQMEKVNSDFERVMGELEKIRQVSFDPKVRGVLKEELKKKEIIDLFESVEHDFEKLRGKLSMQSIEEQRIASFIESFRTKREFSFKTTGQSTKFLEQAIDLTNSKRILMKPEFVGTIDVAKVASEISAEKIGPNILLEKDMLRNLIEYSVANKIMRNVIFEANRTTITYKNSDRVVVEADGLFLKRLERLAKEI